MAADPGGNLYNQHVDDEGSIVGEGAATGLTSGAVVGGLLGLLIGAGLIFVPVGLLAAGPIVGLIAGGAAGAATGGILGGLIGLGIPKEEASVYAESVRRGGTLVSVTTEDVNAPRAHSILDRDGAVDVEERSARYRAEGFTHYDETLPVLSEPERVAAQEQANDSPTFPPLGGSNDIDSPPRTRTYDTSTWTGAYADAAPETTPTGVPNSTPGVQTGGHAVDGTPDTRGITEKVADTLTGDDIDDKTGKRVD